MLLFPRGRPLFRKGARAPFCCLSVRAGRLYVARGGTIGKGTVQGQAKEGVPFRRRKKD